MADSKHLHFLGIYGHAMRGLAAAAQELGNTVTGTDDGKYPPTEWLEAHPDIQTWNKPAVSHLKDIDEIIISGHIQPDHPELVAAQEKGIPVRSFPELVAELTKRARRIVVAGTHGKTTTTSLLTWIFETAGHHPDYLIGIKPHNFDSSVRLAGSRVAVIEGDEYRSSQLSSDSKFVHYHPDVLVLTSIEMDHPDFFKDLADITGRFKTLVASVPKKDGRLVYWKGSETVRKIATSAKAPADSYDAADADWSSSQVRFGPDGIQFTLRHHDEDIGQFQTRLYGPHNVLNATAAIAVALEEGVAVDVVQQALETFEGSSRRFDLITEPGDTVTVLDDYAHHPTEAKATIEAATLHFPGRVIAVYKPHTYSRTQELLKEYHGAFGDADVIFITEIESAREESKAKTVSGADVAKGIGKNAKYVADRSKLLKAVLDAAEPGDTIVSMSVNGNDGFAEALAAKLKERA
ncbi:UDP-N-acetylmuramate--L-alanine ligase [Patescibacteria group bacterium]|nr:UDP-N-acetylmuramate--L-alanine ligase [Patescibacteria group bacterium]